MPRSVWTLSATCARWYARPSHYGGRREDLLFRTVGRPVAAPGKEALVILFTAHYGVRDADRLDVTRAGCDQLIAAGKPAPGEVFAPSAALLRGGLRERAATRGDEEAARNAWSRYAEGYRGEMRTSYLRHRAAWTATLAKPRLVVVCFCSGEDAAAKRCHRFLLASYFAALGADYRGELTEADRVAPERPS